MKPEFIACNHGCRCREPAGMATNGSCKFPRLDFLNGDAQLFAGHHDDPEVRRFARKVVDLLAHIKEV